MKKLNKTMLLAEVGGKARRERKEGREEREERGVVLLEEG